MEQPGLNRPRRQGIVVGQRVRAEKMARGLRREMTAAEQLPWEALRGGQLQGVRFRRQQVIDGFIVDFYCHAAGLIVEVDGSVHRGPDAYDVPRDTILAARGLCILRFPNEQVFTDLPAVLATIHAAIQQSAQESAHSQDRGHQ